jgi:hypothetical protein
MLTTDLSYISLILQTFFTIGDGAKKIGGVPPSSFILRPPLWPARGRTTASSIRARVTSSGALSQLITMRNHAVHPVRAQRLCRRQRGEHVLGSFYVHVLDYRLYSNTSRSRLPCIDQTEPT